jgi:hypothetical protein
MATVTASYNWVSGETVTPAKLNSTAAPTVVVADNEVTTAKIADANVTNAKLASGIDASKITTGTLPIARIADAAVTPAKLSQPLTLATAQGTTSGTAIDFTGIPSWVKRITMMFSNVSTNGTSPPIVQIGAGSVKTSDYAGVAFYSSGSNNISSGIPLGAPISQSSDTRFGSLTISNSSGNTWVVSGNIAYNNASAVVCIAGGVELSGVLDRVRLTTFGGSDTFDGGFVNIMYEG